MSGHFDDPLDLVITKRRRRHKHRRSPFFATGIHAIQHQYMKMRIEIQRATEALDKGHTAALDLGVALCPRLLAIPGLNRAEKHRQKSTDKRTVVG